MSYSNTYSYKHIMLKYSSASVVHTYMGEGYCE